MEPYGLDAIVGFERLPFLKVGVFAGGQSSFDRAGGNDDANKVLGFLGIDAAGDKIMLDLTGAGTVYRIWFTGYDTTAYMKVYVDGTLTLHYLKDLFAASGPGFATRLVAEQSGGSYCYLPIPFSKSIRITTNGAVGRDEEGHERAFYYNIGYHRYAAGTPIVAWTGAENVSHAQAVWDKSATGADPRPDRETAVVEYHRSVAKHDALTLLDLPGPRSISSLKLNLGTVDADVLNNVWLRAWWDERPDAAVNAPLSAFFAVGRFSGAGRSRSLAVGITDDNWMYSYFPMPLAHHARVELVNELDSPINVQCRIEHEPFTEDVSRVGYFTTYYRHQSRGDGESLMLIDVEGSGHLVGVVVSIEGPRLENQTASFCWRNGANYLCFLEGDERIYVDECRTPVIHGTGMEDFFNAGWYFETGPFSAPLHGCTTKEDNRNGHGIVSAYRLFLQDAVPFRKHLRATLEHGPTNDGVPVVAWTLAYYYYQPFVRAFCHDVLDVGNASSERAHAYTISGDRWEGSRTFTFEGDYDRDEITETGRAHQGASEFTISMPRDNQGILLRRMFDQGIPNQQAEVFVDGAADPVGLWVKAGGNTTHKWCEDDFIIPAALTLGRTSLHIRLKFVPTDLPATKMIVAAGGNLYQLQESGVVWKYVGPPTNWQALDNNPATKKIVAAGGNLYQLHDYGTIWKYVGPPTNWQALDNNPATVDIVADGNDLYQMHSYGTIWKYVGPPTNWLALENNPAVDWNEFKYSVYALHETGEVPPG
jgi:hypothetical protein